MGFQNYPFSTGQAAVLNTATLIVAANAARSGITITNITGTAPVYIIENTNGTTNTGHYLAGTAGASVSFSTTGAVYGIVSSTTQTVSYLQTQ